MGASGESFLPACKLFQIINTVGSFLMIIVLNKIIKVCERFYFSFDWKLLWGNETSYVYNATAPQDIYEWVRKYGFFFSRRWRKRDRKCAKGSLASAVRRPKCSQGFANIHCALVFQLKQMVCGWQSLCAQGFLCYNGAIYILCTER